MESIAQMQNRLVDAGTVLGNHTAGAAKDSVKAAALVAATAHFSAAHRLWTVFFA